MALPPTAVSAPGKVLLAGGYLVLDRQYTGLVFGLDARIHVQVKPLPTSTGVSLQEIIVKSPQFTHATWRYGYHLAAHKGGIVVTPLEDSSTQNQPNDFVETALVFALSYISTSMSSPVIEPAAVTILADDDYYSQDKSTVPVDGTKINSRFRTFNIAISKAHKTGLGSSAALVTSLVGAVLSHYLPAELFSLETEIGKRRLHNLAQAAHSAAQGKIGSGFDVAAAVYGSCVYRRFSPSFLEGLGEIGSNNFASRLRALVEEATPELKWDTEITKAAIKVPQGLRLVMCDVDCGSKTPGMVKQVLEWRKKSPELADKIWSNLQSKNEELADHLLQLAHQQKLELQSLGDIIEGIRKLVREMSNLSGVPIEPKAQTDLLDACTRLRGVIGGVAPGAGGYDAVALLVQDDEEVTKSLTDLLRSWRFETDDTGTLSGGKVRMLGVREEMEGIRVEDASSYGNSKSS